LSRRPAAVTFRVPPGDPALAMNQPLRRRTRAREIALQLLYQFDLRGERYEEELGEGLPAIVAAEAHGDEEVVGFALRLVQGTLEQRDALDQRLRAVTRNWDLKRMAAVDRNVLRMAIYELGFCPDIPPKVTINEAIELGKRFSTANSGGFINGILDRVRLDLEQERQQKSASQEA
jgi:transcription antitermination factor NusB